MVHTVGIIGINGNVGAAALPALVKAAQADKIKLVVFHREGSPVKGASAEKNIELRNLDFEHEPEKIEQAIKGVNVFISAVGFSALPSEPKLVDALAKSPDLVTYIPSIYSTTWTEDNYTDEQLGPILRSIQLGGDRAKELKMNMTYFYTGIFDLYFFCYNFPIPPLKENTILANEKQMQHRFPITALEHLGNAIAKVASSDPESIKNKEYSVITFQPTGNELRDLYTKLNGKPATIKDFNKAERDALRADAASFGPAKAGYLDKWEADSFGYEAEGRITDFGYDGLTLEEVAKKFL